MAIARFLTITAFLLGFVRSRYAGAVCYCDGTSCTKVDKHCKYSCTNITEFPKDIPENTTHIKIVQSELKGVKFEEISLPESVEDLEIHLSTLPENIGKFKTNRFLKVLKIESVSNNEVKITPGAFDNLTKLIYLSLAGAKINTFPAFHRVHRKLERLGLDRNNIKGFKAKDLSKLPALKYLYLSHNKFTSLQNGMFPAENKIEELHMAGNRITSIEPNAFKNLSQLITLNLDGIDIVSLPTKGLANLRILRLEHVTRLKNIPSGLEKIEKVVLAKEKSFLCCKLIYSKIEPHLTGPRSNYSRQPRSNYSRSSTPKPNSTPGKKAGPTMPPGFGKRRKRELIPLPPDASPSGTFNTVPTSKPLNCTPKPTAFQPCEDIMGAEWLTGASFIIAPFALCGNFVVLVVFVCLARNYNVSRFLVTNLALADMTMGIYLLSLVIESVITEGEYYAHVERFQFGLSCKVLGFLAMFSSELSVFSLTMITVERYLTIVYAMYPRYRLTMRSAAVCMFIGWIVAITVALLPILGVGSYGKVAICLPFDTENGGDLYLFCVFGLNGVSFLFICALYAQIYRSVFKTKNSTPTRGHDSRVARRMAILVFTDFACFTPIAITSISALLGTPLINVTQSKYLLVFFFPLNGLLNPFLYAIITKTFRRDLAIILKNCFVCGGTLTNYISNLPARSVQSTNDVLSPSARPSLDFNAMEFHSLGNIRGSRENPISGSFSKSEPNLVKFSQNDENS